MNNKQKKKKPKKNDRIGKEKIYNKQKIDGETINEKKMS